ncbi:hypothetical protein ACPA9J_05125 [Pseudomonas aeruginosa]
MVVRGGGDRKGRPTWMRAFRKLQDSLNGLFGGKKRSGNGSGSGSGGKGGGLGLFGIGLAILAVLWLYNAIYVVDEQGAGGHPALRQVLRDGRSRPELLPADRRRFQEASPASVRTASRGRCSPRTRTSSKCR